LWIVAGGGKAGSAKLPTETEIAPAKASARMKTNPPQPGQKTCSFQRPASLPRRQTELSPSIAMIALCGKMARQAKAEPVARWHSLQAQR